MGPYQDLLFLGIDRPIVLRLRLIVDGQPFEMLWQNHARRLFKLADRDGDGHLSPEEIQTPAKSDDVLWDEAFTILTLPGLTQSDLAPPDGSLSFEEFAAFVSRHRGEAFQSPPRFAATNNLGQVLQAPQATQPGQKLFETLDQDGDGGISLEELHDSFRSIRKLDFDGDGTSSLNELDHVRGAFGRASNMPGAASAVPIRPLSPNRQTNELIDAVVSAYGGTTETGIPLSLMRPIGNQEPQWWQFDVDGNERLDCDELRYCLTHPHPDVELIVRVGRREEGEQAVTVQTPPVFDDLTTRTSDQGLVSLVSDNVHLEIGVAPDSRNEATLREFYSNRFQQFDRDGNGYLEKTETGGDPLFGESFNRFDRDGDGKLFEEEMFAVVAGQIVASLSRTSMTTANRGKDLFEILDANRDQRVSRRELLAAEKRFDLWDVDEDGQMSDSEVPQLYQLVFDRGMPDMSQSSVTVVNVSLSPSSTIGTVVNSDGPVWFRKMDRNADGDVSRREFLGTRKQFDELDADKNDLLDAGEAMQIPPSE